MAEITQLAYEALEVEAQEARFQFLQLVIGDRKLHLAYNRMQATERRLLDARRARREAEVHE
jgi:hypothetical protein